MTRYYTQPVSSPKQPFSPRGAAFDDDLIVDVSEFSGSEMSCPSSPPIPVAVTAAVWDAAEEIPFREICDTTLEDRLEAIVKKAGLALSRARASLCGDFENALAGGLAMDFAVGLGRRSGDPEYGFLRVHCGPTEDGELVATIGLPEEL